MTVLRYRRKPRPGDEGVLTCALYKPGQPLTDLRAVAQLADPGVELAEVELPSGAVLLFRWTDLDADQPEARYDVVKAGDYLAYGPSGGLYDTSDGDLRHWYDPMRRP